MNWTHMHLLLSHLPVVGTLVGLVLLAAALLRRNTAVQAAALAVLVGSAATAVPVYVTGEPAEEVVEELAGVSGAAIEAHEESALVSLVSVGLLAVVAALAWMMSRRGHRAARRVAVATLAFGIVTAALLARTANLGGRVRHSEIGGVAAGEVEDGGADENDDETRR